jgi:hypothetical protein
MTGFYKRNKGHIYPLFQERENCVYSSLESETIVKRLDISYNYDIFILGEV